MSRRKKTGNGGGMVSGFDKSPIWTAMTILGAWEDNGMYRLPNGKRVNCATLLNLARDAKKAQ